MLINCLLVVSFIFVTFFKTKRSLHMLQQNLYNENQRYLKWVLKNYKQFMDLDILLVIISLIGAFVIYDLESVSFIAYLFLIAISFFLGYCWIQKMNHDQNKKPLVVTARIKRLIVTIFILYFIPVCFWNYHFDDVQFVWGMILLVSIMIYLNTFVVFVANIINYPIERMIYHYYKHKAQSKLRSMNHLKIIGITGSYGKTSSKNILSDILNIKYNALPTPRNLNTYNGLIMTVNNDMDKFTDIFIAEMGAYVKGEIKGLCDLVKPKYGILTRIGTAHLESFGSEQNIIDGKFELIESLPKDGFAILNGDDEKQLHYPLKNPVRTIWIGIDNPDVDVLAKDIHCSNKGTEFTVVFKGDKKKHHFQTKLLGNHNVYNILAAIACGREFGIEVDDLIQAVKMVRPVEHRLELKRLGNFYQIDDAYNSNPVGAENACKVLGMMPGIRVVVTPGMIELGKKENEYNRTFGTQIAEIADYVVLIGEKKTKPIYQGLIQKGFDKDKIIVFNDVRDAYPFIETLTGKEDVYALFENDLPDTYNE